MKLPRFRRLADRWALLLLAGAIAATGLACLVLYEALPVFEHLIA